MSRLRLKAEFVALAILSLLVFGSEAQQNEERIMKLEKAGEVIAHMNLSADPCEDFYNFACGNWERKHAGILQRNRIITVEHHLETKINKDLQSVLEEPQKHNDNINMIKVKDFFHSCQTAASSSPSQHTFLVNFIKKNGGLPLVSGTNWHNNYNWLQTVAKLRAHYGIEVLIGMQIDINSQTMMGQSIYFSEPKTSILPVELCSKVAMKQVNAHEQEYEVFQTEISKNLQKWISLKPADANRLAGDVISFEFKLCKHMRKEQALPNNSFSHDMHSDHHQQKYRNFNGLPSNRNGHSRSNDNKHSNGDWYLTLQQLNEHFANKIDFRNFTQTIFNASINDHVFLRSESYFVNLARLVSSQSKNTLANYIIYKALAAFNFPIDDRRTKRSHYCVELVKSYFPKIAGEMYSKKFQENDAFGELYTILRDLKVAFEDNLKTDWLKENLKRVIKQELASYAIMQPGKKDTDLNSLDLRNLDFWHKLELVMNFNAREYLDNLKTYTRPSESLESFHTHLKSIPLGRHILMGYGLLQPPFYHRYFSNSLKYSVIGQKIAKELVRLVDEPFWNENEANSLRRDASSREAYRERAECYRQQFSNYLYNSPEIFQNASLLRDIIADSEGLKIAFNAYLSWLDRTDATNIGYLRRETLPDVNFTNTQLFFINFAQSHCFGRRNEKHIPHFTPYESHSVDVYMVNGPLSNFDEFSREFSCKPGTEMNIDDKCVIY